MIQTLPSQQYHFTETGYQLIPLPLLIRKEIKSYFNDHLHESFIEEWDPHLLASSSFSSREKFLTNHWLTSTRLLPLDNSFLDHVLVTQIQPHLEEWIHSPVSLVHSPLWRVYGKGSLIAPHVDLPPHVLTIVIQIDFDDDQEEVDEEEMAVAGESQRRWPVQLIDPEGFEHSLIIARGDILIYEVWSLYLLG
jgi:hypothetical protein